MNVSTGSALASIVSRGALRKQVKFSNGGTSSARRSYISTGLPSLDIALGGGYLHGRIVECFGGATTGKTSLGLHAVREVQQDNGIALWVDLDNTLDAYHAKRMGVDVSELLFMRPQDHHQMVEMVLSALRSGAYALIVIDTIAATTPGLALGPNGGVETHANLVFTAMSRFLEALDGQETVLMVINQTRNRTSVLFGNNETSTGGRCLKQYAATRLKVSGCLENVWQDESGQYGMIEIVKSAALTSIDEVSLPMYQHNPGR